MILAMATLDRLAPPPTSSFPARTAWSPRRAIAAVLTVAAAIALLQVFQSSSFANTGQSIQKLEAQRLDSSARVHQLEAEVAALSSLDRIERNARDRLGMVPARNITYVQVAVPAPDDPLLPRPVLSPAPVPAARPSLWHRLLRLLPL
jgi:cell division protein FtsL